MAFAVLLSGAGHPWRSPGSETAATERLDARFQPPPGFERVPEAEGSFGAWLRSLPVHVGRPAVRLHSGELKRNQRAHVAVIDIDVGPRDLQQCADASMRLRAEYLWAAGRADAVCFVAAAGYAMPWRKWRTGMRPSGPRGRVWQRSGRAGGGYASFRRYLDRVFGVANTASIRRQMQRIPIARLRAGDVFLQGATAGRYGHAVTVMDVVENAAGQRRLLLSQSYMPAQQMHVLRGPGGSDDPWYPAPAAGEGLRTPEWDFPPGSLHRFSERGCGR